MLVIELRSVLKFDYLKSKDILKNSIIVLLISLFFMFPQKALQRSEIFEKIYPQLFLSINFIHLQNSRIVNAKIVKIRYLRSTLAAHHYLLTSKISNGAYLYAEWLSVLSYV